MIRDGDCRSSDTNSGIRYSRQSADRRRSISLFSKFLRSRFETYTLAKDFPKGPESPSAAYGREAGSPELTQRGYGGTFLSHHQPRAKPSRIRGHSRPSFDASPWPQPEGTGGRQSAATGETPSRIRVYLRRSAVNPPKSLGSSIGRPPESGISNGAFSH